MATDACGVCSLGVSRLTGLTSIDQAVRLIKQAGAPSESATERDGFLSYAAETHAAGAGLGVGFTIAASGELRWFGLVYQAVILGNRGDRLFEGRLLSDIQGEKYYFLGGLVAGAAFGLLARFVTEGLSVA